MEPRLKSTRLIDGEVKGIMDNSHSTGTHMRSKKRGLKDDPEIQFPYTSVEVYWVDQLNV